MVFQELASEGCNVSFMVNHLTVDQFDRYARLWICKCEIAMRQNMPKSSFTKHFHQVWSKAKQIDENVFSQLLTIVQGIAAAERYTYRLNIG